MRSPRRARPTSTASPAGSGPSVPSHDATAPGFESSPPTPAPGRIRSWPGGYSTGQRIAYAAGLSAASNGCATGSNSPATEGGPPMIDTEPTAKPTTLVEVARQLDEHRVAIDAIQSESDAEVAAAMASVDRLKATAEAAIAGHRDAARSLLGTQDRLTRNMFAAPVTTTKRVPRIPATNGERPANIISRKRNENIRQYAAEHGLECPAKGTDFSQQLLDAFNHDGYTG